MSTLDTDKSCCYSGFRMEIRETPNRRENMTRTIEIDGREISANEWDGMVALMDDAIRESVHVDLAPCSPEEFFAEYQTRHQAKFGESFAW